METRTIYLHVGTYKTGTSALQLFFNRNRERLLRNGLHYARTGIGGRAHFPLAGLCRKDVPEDLQRATNGMGFEWGRNSLRNEIGRCPVDRILFSCEDFERSDVAKLAEFFRGYHVKVIIYLRRQDYYAQSFAAQMEKMGISCNNHDRYKPIASLPPRDKARLLCLDYRKWLLQLGSAFGNENIIVRVYEKEQLPDGIFPDFLKSLGMQWSPDYELPADEINPSITDRDLIEFKYLLNQLQLPDDPLRNIIEGLDKHWSSTKTGNSGYLLSPMERCELLARYEEDNRFIAINFLQREDGRLFFEPWPDVNESWEPYTGLEVNKVVEIFGWIVTRLVGALADTRGQLDRQGGHIREQQQAIKGLESRIQSLESDSP